MSPRSQNIKKNNNRLGNNVKDELYRLVAAVRMTIAVISILGSI